MFIVNCNYPDSYPCFVIHPNDMYIKYMNEGNSSIGKRAFMKADEGSIGMEYIQMRRQELQHFKLEWYIFNTQSNSNPLCA